jgi:hypothetical protein
MLSLPDPAPVPGLGLPHVPPVLAPAPRPALSRLRGAAGGGPAAGLAVAQVLAGFGADRPPRYQQPLPVQPERARVPAHRHEATLAPREPGRLLTFSTASGRGEPGVRIPAQHRPRAFGVQLAECARPGTSQLPAQLPVPSQRASWRPRRHAFSSSTQHHTSPAERSSPNSRRSCPRVADSPHRAVRYTTRGASGSRLLGIRPSNHRLPTKPLCAPCASRKVAVKLVPGRKELRVAPLARPGGPMPGRQRADDPLACWV